MFVEYSQFSYDQDLFSFKIIFQAKPASGSLLSGMKTKIFGSETPEQKEHKLKQLEEQIELAELEVKQTNEAAE